MKLLLLCFIVLAQFKESKSCFREERRGLLDIKALLTSYNDSSIDDHLSSWVIHPHSNCCKWNLVTCDRSSGHVIKLSLGGLWILAPFAQGNVSIDLNLFRNFKMLRSLTLSEGNFDTLIGIEVLANLSSLEILSLKGNHLHPLSLQGLCGLKKIRVLDLSINNFNGPLPKCFANMTSLQALDLSGNLLSGDIPESVIAGLASLEYISLLYNQFQGSFSLSSFANNSQLKVLTLEMSTNKLQVNTEGQQGALWVPPFQLQFLHIPNCKLNMPRGSIPTFLLYQQDLQYLNLANNGLVGVFPNWLLANNTKLRSLILHDNLLTEPFHLPANFNQRHPHPLQSLLLSNNKLVGELPQDIGKIFSNVEYLNVSGNGIHGSIPDSVGNMSKLRALDLSQNNFSGEVPQLLWTGCVSLEYLMLSHNSFWGHIFPSPLKLSHLELLFMDNNYFNGTLQHGILGLPNLKVFDISDNRLWGTVPSFIANISSLDVINFSGNNFEGELPRELCKLDLLAVHMSHNQLSGTIPACYLNMEKLFSLRLQSNSLVGTIPEFKRATYNLTSLDLRDNNLSGSIPDSIDSRLAGLIFLLLGGNHLQGNLPNQLCQLNGINILDLSRNNFTGNIPRCFYNASFASRNIFVVLAVKLGTGDSMYKYSRFNPNGLGIEFRTKASLYLYAGNKFSMSGIDLSCNQLSGTIPLEIGYLSFLRALNLSHNHLNGSIPNSFQELKWMESLDLSYNNLSGQIPSQLQDLNALAMFDVSYNNLSGQAPDKGQFGSFDGSSYEGNPHLHWYNSNRGTTPPPPPLSTTVSNNVKEEEESAIDFTVFYWSFASSYIMVLLVLATILWINPHWRRRWRYFIETCLLRCFNRFLGDAFH